MVTYKRTERDSEIGEFKRTKGHGREGLEDQGITAKRHAALLGQISFQTQEP